MKRITIAKILAIAASAMGTISLYSLVVGGDTSDFVAACMVLAPLLGFVSYCLCGFFKAICTPFGLAKWGFLVAPFPFSLVVVVVLFLVGILSIAYIPAIPVLKRAAELGC